MIFKVPLACLQGCLAPAEERHPRKGRANCPELSLADLSRKVIIIADDVRPILLVLQAKPKRPEIRKKDSCIGQAKNSFGILENHRAVQVESRTASQSWDSRPAMQQENKLQVSFWDWTMGNPKLALARLLALPDGYRIILHASKLHRTLSAFSWDVAKQNWTASVNKSNCKWSNY